MDQAQAYNKAASPFQPLVTEDWERHREQITHFYVVEERKLREITGMMEKEHGFKATERQYKKRIKDWQIDNKNIRELDMKFVISKQLKRRLEEGKATDFEINGRVVPQQKMRRFTLRKALSKDDIIKAQLSTPAYITYYTPKTQPRDNYFELCNAPLLSTKDIGQSDGKPKDPGLGDVEKVHEVENQSGRLEMDSQDPSRSKGVERRSSASPSSATEARSQEKDWPKIFGRVSPIASTHSTENLAMQQNGGLRENCERGLTGLGASLSPPPPGLLLPPDRPVPDISSPFERWSQRYDLFSSPNWIQVDMTPGNPLTLLSPPPIGTPWSNGSNRTMNSPTPIQKSQVAVDVSFVNVAGSPSRENDEEREKIEDDGRGEIGDKMEKETNEQSEVNAENEDREENFPTDAKWFVPAENYRGEMWIWHLLKSWKDGIKSCDFKKEDLTLKMALEMYRHRILAGTTKWERFLTKVRDGGVDAFPDAELQKILDAVASVRASEHCEDLVGETISIN